MQYMNYAFFFIGFLPLYTLINSVIYLSIYKKWIREKTLILAFPKWEGTQRPNLFFACRLFFILASYLTPWLFGSSPRATLFNLMVFLPIHLFVDELITRYLRKRIRTNAFNSVIDSEGKAGHESGLSG
jgi:hypothetical protein